MSSLRGNKGEWSELYVLLKVLADGKIYGADEFLDLREDIFYNILKVIRLEKKNGVFEYNRNLKNIQIVDIENDISIEIDISKFIYYSNFLFDEIKNIKGREKNYITEIDSFLKSIKVNKLTADNSTKSDITIQVRDSNTGSEPILDFSIKSQLGSPPTLLNASKATNFKYELSEVLEFSELKRINSIEGGPKFKLNELESKGISLEFKECMNKNFQFNLQMIDYEMPKIVADALLYSNSKQVTKISDIFTDEHIEDKDDLCLYTHKFKQLLMNVALGMMPSKKWSGDDEATGGYIVVKRDGDLACFHLYNRNSLKNYLFISSKFENGSQSRHDFGKLYNENGKTFFNLNLQIRFLS